MARWPDGHLRLGIDYHYFPFVSRAQAQDL